MLDAAVPILKEIYRRFPRGGADLETICQIVTGVTHIDRVHYTRFDVPRTNPIWGSFRRFEQQDAPYAGNVTVVHVRYAQHLTEDERVFIVSKELCHSLEQVDGAHAVTDSAVDDLVAAFSLWSSAKANLVPNLTAFNLELLAMIVATEMVCPIRHRRAVMEGAGDDPDWQALGAQLKVPEPYLRAVCDLSQLASIERVLKDYGAL